MRDGPGGTSEGRRSAKIKDEIVRKLVAFLIVIGALAIIIGPCSRKKPSVRITGKIKLLERATGGGELPEVAISRGKDGFFFFWREEKAELAQIWACDSNERQPVMVHETSEKASSPWSCSYPGGSALLWAQGNRDEPTLFLSLFKEGLRPLTAARKLISLASFPLETGAGCAYSRGKFFFVWGEEEGRYSSIKMLSFDESGKILCPPRKLTGNSSRAVNPVIVPADGILALSWYDAQRPGIYFAAYSERGRHLVSPVRLSDRFSGSSHDLVYMGERFGACWVDFPSRSNSVYLTILDKAGKVVMKPRPVTPILPPGKERRVGKPALHWNGEGLSLAWGQVFGGKEKVLFRGISKEGDVTGSVEKLAPEGGTSPFLIGEGRSLSCFWLEKRKSDWVLSLAELIPSRVGKR